MYIYILYTIYNKYIYILYITNDDKKGNSSINCTQDLCYTGILIYLSKWIPVYFIAL